ncbi:ABC transporter related protein [Caldalkalibacillus thermarum TA2.A1]|uniref:Carnitine transport ATP-binding protein OpuCA n=1 Tax=Caldalkalibacillus thermarum (strain TA2.A1) TaxID=986075 RepID=F5LAD5_CALTT|nr:ABC transporter related protein [Caldalkalibacillus thermarum TA2.A1]GGK35583.1 iron ABC transporter ATP-binding protein [Caldalkalibacillus thermarum]
MGVAFIQIKQLTKHFKDALKPAVDRFELDIEQGEIITLLGPSGCGKTTTLRMIAGFEQPSSGQIIIGGKVVHDAHFSLPPEKRGIGMVFQDYALFPHLTIEKNIMFGLAKWKTKEKKERTQEILELVGLSQFADRYPHQLSGGQQQRVALARALAPRPNVVLMDEPFSNLDAGLREKMRYEVTNILRKTNTTAIIVTHDQKDAFAVSDRVVVMNEGVIQQVAAPREMYRCPKNCFVAQFLGKTNLISGTLADDLKHVYTHIGKVCLPEKTKAWLETVTLSIRPEGCRLVDGGRYCGQVENVIYSGEYQELEVKVKTDDGRYESMILYAPVEQEIEVGQIVSFDIAPELVAVVEQ